MFLARIELAQMIGVSLDSRHIPEPEDNLRERLGESYTRTNKVLSHTLQNERAFSGPNEIREMELGIGTINFEYLHILMVLLKSHSPSSNLRLETAREAISLLPSLISNWTSVYNPMICKIAIQRDLELLSITVSYYSTMREQMQMLAPLCKRLENIAAVFLRLAKQYVDGPHPFVTTQQLSAKAHTVGSSEEENSDMALGDTQMEIGSEIGVDLEHYIQWLPPNMISTQDSHTTVISDGHPAHGPSTSASPESVQRESRGTKRPFDVMFDWFAWDVYYGEQNDDIV
ncbi:hypothetical protein H9Q70_002407 [Fusarium xylarioides]|nr:hypothetical protein H9Q70_002407 [Fusarium xylarioides]